MEFRKENGVCQNVLYFFALSLFKKSFVVVKRWTYTNNVDVCGVSMMSLSKVAVFDAFV